MKFIEGTVGRIFVLRLDHDDPIPLCIEDFAAEKQIQLRPESDGGSAANDYPS